MNFDPELIGVGKYTGELAHWLAERGHTVEVVAAHPHYPGFAAQGAGTRLYRRTREGRLSVTRCPLLLRKGGRGIWRLLAPLSFAVAAAPILLWRAFRLRPQIVLCVEPTLFAAPAAILAARLAGARLVLHVQDLEADAAFATGCLRGDVLQRFGMKIERALLCAFDAIVTISDAMARRLAGKGTDKRRLSVLRNWIAFAPAVPQDEVRRLRERLGIVQGEQVVLYAGHLGAKQDVPLLLAALRRFSAMRAVRVVIAGDGPMASRVAAAGLPNLVQLPLQSPSEYRILLAMADLHVLPQDSRAADLVFPSKLGPMLATGRPVVVTADPASDLARWAADAVAVVPAGDADALALGLRDALDGWSDAGAARARTLARTLDADVILPAFEALLMRLLCRPQPATEGTAWPVPDFDAPVAQQR